MEPACPLHLLRERLAEAAGKHRDAVLGPFAVAHENLGLAEVDVFDAQAHAFHQAQPRAVEDAGDQVVRGGVLQGGEQRLDLVAGEDDGQALGPFGAFDLLDGG
jgi:hypothetical protein